MRPTLALLYGAAFWGVVWYPTRWLEQQGMHGAWVTLVAYGVSSLALLTYFRQSVHGLRHQPWEVAGLFLAAGWTNIAFILAVLDGEVVRVVLLFYLSPIWTTLFGRWLLDEQFTARTLVMLGLGMTGAVIMMWDPALGEVPLNHADLLAISAGVTFALNNVMTRRIVSIGVRAKTLIAWLGVITLSIVVIVLVSAGAPQVSAAAWGVTVVLGWSGFLLATLAVVYGVSNMPVQRSAVIMLFELIVGAVSAWWLAGELIERREWVGGALIMVAAMVAIYQEEHDI